MLKVALVQQGFWAMSLSSMPLAAGYLKAALLGCDDLRRELQVEIFNYDGAAHAQSMALRLAEDPPDVVAFSVLGWNYNAFAAVATTFKQLRPDGLVVFGGNHVSHQGERVLEELHAVDVVVNGEGEETFVELMRNYVATGMAGADSISGVTFRRDGDLITTAERERIVDLDQIPSPVLTGAVRLTDDDGRFLYDVALMETNRGCPYRCSFCYWGGATGQRVRSFSRERLRAELEFYAKLEVETVVLCDANFGMLPQDLEFAKDLVEIKEKCGFPRALETSWAKNKSAVFRSIVTLMKDAGLKSSFTIALQSLNESTLQHMNRRNMKLNQWEDLVDWLESLGLSCYAELIWGAPGDTVGTFLDGYDRLATRISRIATYPLLLMPNTEYYDKRSEYGFITVTGRDDDFEYVLAHDELSVADNLWMHSFIFWARLLAENPVLRRFWPAARQALALKQSALLVSIAEWASDPARSGTGWDRLHRLSEGLLDAGKLSEGLRILYARPGVADRLLEWWDSKEGSRHDSAIQGAVREVLRLDLLTLPRAGEAKHDLESHPSWSRLERGGVLRAQRFEFDVDEWLNGLPHGVLLPDSGAQAYDVFFADGFENYLDNHEESFHDVGVPTPVETVAPMLGAHVDALGRRC